MRGGYRWRTSFFRSLKPRQRLRLRRHKVESVENVGIQVGWIFHRFFEIPLTLRDVSFDDPVLCDPKAVKLEVRKTSAEPAYTHFLAASGDTVPPPSPLMPSPPRCGSMVVWSWWAGDVVERATAACSLDGNLRSERTSNSEPDVLVPARYFSQKTKVPRTTHPLKMHHHTRLHRLVSRGSPACIFAGGLRERQAPR